MAETAVLEPDFLLLLFLPLFCLAAHGGWLLLAGCAWLAAAGRWLPADQVACWEQAVRIIVTINKRSYIVYDLIKIQAKKKTRKKKAKFPTEALNSRKVRLFITLEESTWHFCSALLARLGFGISFVRCMISRPTFFT